MIYRVHMNISMRRQNSLYSITNRRRDKNYLYNKLFSQSFYSNIAYSSELLLRIIYAIYLYAIISSLKLSRSEKNDE